MRRILLIGRSESGKTTLKQVLRGENITYKKTQYVSQYDCVIDMPGEYAENLDLAHTIDLYAAESDVVGIVLSATEPYSLYPPNITPLGNRDEVGIVKKYFLQVPILERESKKSLNSFGKNMTFAQ